MRGCGLLHCDPPNIVPCREQNDVIKSRHNISVEPLNHLVATLALSKSYVVTFGSL